MINRVHECDPFLKPYIEALLERKCLDPVLLDIRGMASYADALLISSAKSNRQVKAIAEHIHRTLKKQCIKAFHIEGLQEGHWVLMDYGDVVIHIFYEPQRKFYDLEGLWNDVDAIILED
ncbi:MAG: ribosome silencing factor [Candidatus Magnetomorum sp.]|nr:ribosome silencing factor [Candidatus Magnetomorum sp.]